MQKWTIVKENDIKNKAKNISVVFEGQKMQNTYNGIYRGRNSWLSLFDKQISVYSANHLATIDMGQKVGGLLCRF